MFLLVPRLVGLLAQGGAVLKSSMGVDRAPEMYLATTRYAQLWVLSAFVPSRKRIVEIRGNDLDVHRW